MIIIRYYYVRLNDSSVSQIVMGKSVNGTIESDAYWVTYVREDQTDFQNMLNYNKAPQGVKSSYSWL